MNGRLIEPQQFQHANRGVAVAPSFHSARVRFGIFKTFACSVGAMYYRTRFLDVEPTGPCPMVLHVSGIQPDLMRRHSHVWKGR